MVRSAIRIVTVVKVKGQNNRRSRRKGGRLLPEGTTSSFTLTAIRVTRTLCSIRIDCRSSAHRGTYFTTLALTKHGLLKKMKGARKNIVSRRRGDGGDCSRNEASHQTDSRYNNGCKYEDCVPRRGVGC